MRLQGARTVIIGGGGGIGAAIARRIGGLGAQVIVADVDLASAETVAHEIRSNGSRARAVAADIAVGRDLDALVVEANDWLSGRVDLLINHAGVAIGGHWEAIPDEEWDRVLHTNVTGFAASTRRFLPLMGGDNESWIVNTSSNLGLFHDQPLAGPYIASKSAIIGMSRALAAALSERNIGVSVLCPGLTATTFFASARRYGVDGQPPQGPAQAMPHALSPEDVALALIKGLEARKFLISLAPGTRTRLLQMAEAELAPRSDRLVGPF
ncbi:MAG TPA: SDR family oxidoreductase [Caulobacteraceae bacterium]|jgi:NAD(P)-dependent dehydrogenase (short-subunit alcohol dehydrogenase family)|nr:SDR family oxidoreductase [Caulobacteraceae bacterium]